VPSVEPESAATISKEPDGSVWRASAESSSASSAPPLRVGTTTETCTGGMVFFAAMKVLMVVHQFPPQYMTGTELYAMDLGLSLIAAGHGCAVAKHGNRSATGLSGSADVLEALGVPIALSPEQAAEMIDRYGFGYLHAPAHHPAMRYAGPVRRSLGVRTVFNLLGPLTNPAGVRVHVNGIFARDRCELLARAHGALGSRRALVIHGTGGLDEFAPAGPTFVAELADGAVTTYEVRPADFGLQDSDPAGLAGGTPADNARVALEVLGGKGPEAARNAVVMTAAAALYASGAAPNLKVAAGRAVEVLAGGGALGVLEMLRKIAPRPTPAS